MKLLLGLQDFEVYSNQELGLQLQDNFHKFGNTNQFTRRTETYETGMIRGI